MDNFIGGIVLMVFVMIVVRLFFRAETVYEYERGLLFKKGKLRRTLPPGEHWFLRLYSMVQKVDVRLRTVSIPSQEVLSSDNVTIKITLAAQYTVTDPVVAITKVEKFQDALYMLLQLSLRELVGGMKIDEVAANRQVIGKALFEMSEAKTNSLGLTLHEVDIKDIMFPGDLKNIFAHVVKAQKEGLALLEKARGETAALRNLANAAKMLEGNPALMQLRILQAIETGTGNTMYLGFPSDMMPLRSQNSGQAAETPLQTKTEGNPKRRPGKPVASRKGLAGDED